MPADERFFAAAGDPDGQHKIVCDFEDIDMLC